MQTGQCAWLIQIKLSIFFCLFVCFAFRSYSLSYFAFQNLKQKTFEKKNATRCWILFQSFQKRFGFMHFQYSLPLLINPIIWKRNRYLTFYCRYSECLFFVFLFLEQLTHVSITNQNALSLFGSGSEYIGSVN